MKLRENFQKKTWANKLELRRKLYAIRLKEGESVQEHIKRMTEIFEELSVIDDPVSDSFNVLVTALEANSESVPKMEIITERLLHEEQKLKGKGAVDDERKVLQRSNLSLLQKAWAVSGEIVGSWLSWKQAQLEASKGSNKKAGKPKQAANNAAEKK